VTPAAAGIGATPPAAAGMAVTPAGAGGPSAVPMTVSSFNKLFPKFPKALCLAQDRLEV
jgi:hypothetical protein